MAENKGYDEDVLSSGFSQPGEKQQIQMGTVPQTAQPGSQQEGWMQPPPSMPGVPPGLEYLTEIDQLLVHQQVEILEILTGFETSNKYRIMNNLGQQVYFAAEESGCLMRQCCGPARGFVMHITNNFGQEVIRIVRDFKCCAGCCWFANASCCQVDISIEAPVGQVVGYVRQQYSPCPPKFVVENANKEPIFTIDGPVCAFQCICCPRDIEFPVSSHDGGHIVGRVYKQWAGVVREMFTDADQFGVNFPKDMDVKMKAVMLGAVFIIDFMYFEQKQNSN